MALNTVKLTWDLTDFVQAGQQGTMTLVPNAVLTDTADNIVIGQVARAQAFTGGTGAMPAVVCCDDVQLSPAGWEYTITAKLATGQVIVSMTAPINFAAAVAGVIDLSDLVPAQPLASLGSALLLPSGTPAVGQFPIVQSPGSSQTAWGMPGTAATAAVAVPATAETVAASVTIPAGLPAKASYRVTAWGSVSIGGTAGTFVSKLRIGGLAGVQVASASSGSFSINGTGFWCVDAIVTLQVPGASGTWSGFDRQEESVSGTNSSSVGAGTATADSTAAEVLAVTVALSSATSTASCLGSSAERIA